MRFYLITLILTFIIQCPINIMGQVYGDEIISWDFSEGIPQDWINESESGIGIWEYRGPETDPDINTASAGSCGSSSDPIQSITQENGFVIFDSNYWDDNIGPCGNLGVGPDPGPHLAQLTTSPIDLTGFTTVILTFQQQHKNFNCATYVDLSIDGGENFTQIHANSVQTGYTSPSVEFISIDLSPIAGGESDVRIRFSFEGLYYYWMIDDIALYVPNDNDLFLVDGRYTAFDFDQGDTGLSKLEYSRYPEEMIEPFQCFADALNVGGNNQTNSRIEVSIYNSDNTLLADYSSPGTDIAPTAVNILSTEEFDPPSDIGDYRIDFSLVQDQADDDLDNNFRSKNFSITDFTWARDQNESEGGFVHPSEFTESYYELGNYFESISDEGLKCTSITVAFSEESEVGSLAFVNILDFSRDTILATSASDYEINPYDLNNSGQGKFVTIQLEEPLILTSRFYFVAVGSSQSNGAMSIAVSGESPAQTSIITYPLDNAVFYTTTTPMVRMNIFPTDSEPGCTNPLAFNYNPLADTEDGSCRIAGCTDSEFENYNPEANWDDGTCAVIGCSDPEADNYNPDAEIIDNSTCIYLGCTDSEANNFDSSANQDDGSCLYSEAALSFEETSGCAPFSVFFSNQTDVVPEAACSILIDEELEFDDCAVTDFEYTFEEPGVYTITYTYQVGEFTSEFTQEITVTPQVAVPIISFDGVNNEIFCSNCDDSNVYNWYLNMDLILEDAPTTIVNPQDGSYTLQIDNGSNCISESDPLAVVGLDDISNSPELLIFPNPTSGSVTVSSPVKEIELLIINSLGEAVKSFILSGKGNHLLDLADLSSGIYLLTSSDMNLHVNRRLILE